MKILRHLLLNTARLKPASRRALLTAAAKFDTVDITGIENVKMLRDKLEKYIMAMKQTCSGSPMSASAHDNLGTRDMSDSFDRVVVPLSTDAGLRLQYQNHLGKARFGRLLEDLDTFAVWLSYLHNQSRAHRQQPPMHHPMLLVTACVDRISLRVPYIEVDRDIVLEGHVSWVGRSSIEASIQCMQHTPTDGWRQALEAKFVMVALDPKNSSKTVPVHPLRVTDAHEQSLFDKGQESQAVRKAEAQKSLLKTPPDEKERLILHDLFLQTIDEKAHTFRHRQLPAGHVWIHENRLKNVIICFPEQRNLYNKIFGGFLMRQAFELAWTNVAMFTARTPRILAVDDINFRRSVEIGSLLFLSSEVCYTDGRCMQVRVHAECVVMETQQRYTTNTFHFTFATRDTGGVNRVMPKTYADGMLYLSGKRHFDSAMADGLNV